jgi:hypothetical protein
MFLTINQSIQFKSLTSHIVDLFFSMTSNWARGTRTYEILKLENMDEDRCYVQLYFSMINCQVADHRTCPLHP